MYEVNSQNNDDDKSQSEQNKETDSALIEDNEQLLNQEKKIKEKIQEIPKFIIEMSFTLLLSYLFCFTISFVVTIRLPIFDFQNRIVNLVLPLSLIPFLLLVRFLKFLRYYQICIFGFFTLLLLLNSILIWYLFVLINFHAVFGLLLVQLHITYTISTERKMELKIINFWLSILCGCSVMLIPCNLHSLWNQLGFNAFMEPNFLYILPTLFFLYTFMYVISIRQISNGKFSLNDNQTLIGAVLIFANMIFPFIPEYTKK